MTDRDLLKMALEALERNRRMHYQCEDSWYSCPKAGCSNDAEGDECNCGADRTNAEFDAAITALRERLAQPEFDDALQSAAMTQTAAKLAQPEQKRPQMRRATREEKIDRPGVYWVPMKQPERCMEHGECFGGECAYKQPEQEPVAWACRVVHGKKWLSVHASQGASSRWLEYRIKEQAQGEQYEQVPLYTTPPRRQWVGLTDEERLDAERLADQQYLETRGQELRPSWASLFYRAIEAKLKEKNA